MYLSERTLDLGALIERVAAPERGGIATFIGNVRDHHRGRSVLRLEYSAYPAMAEAECERIVRDAESRWPVSVGVVHRIGRLDIGDAAIVVAAAGAHRDEAFAACRFVIEEVKARVPIWKREYYADGTEAWVDPTAPSAEPQSSSAEPVVAGR